MLVLKNKIVRETPRLSHQSFVVYCVFLSECLGKVLSAPVCTVCTHQGERKRSITQLCSGDKRLNSDMSTCIISVSHSGKCRSVARHGPYPLPHILFELSVVIAHHIFFDRNPIQPAAADAVQRSAINNKIPKACDDWACVYVNLNTADS
jgi:hypothetical protein